MYQKHNSFINICHQGMLSDVLPRIQNLNDSLPTSSIAQARKVILIQACEQLLDKRSSPESSRPFTLQTNVVEEINRLTDAELPNYLFYRYRYEIYPQQRILDACPPLVQIEPSSVCNYRCVFCFQTDPALTAKTGGHMGYMALPLFKSIIDQLIGECDGVTLASRGEPLACPDINGMLAYMSGKFLASKINTNASLLNDEKSHAILSADFQTVVFSADAASATTYEQYRVGGKLERILKNIQRFQEIRLKHYPHSRVITRVSGVKVPGTPDLDEMVRFWGDFVDQVAFVQYNPWENTYLAPLNDIVIPCSDLWRRMFIWWDGTVNPCDVDYLSKLRVGNIKESTVSALWRSPAYEQLRRRHLDNQRSACFPCQRCTVV